MRVNDVKDVKDVKELVSPYNNMYKCKNMYFPTRPLTCLTSLTPCNTNTYRGDKLNIKYMILKITRLSHGANRSNNTITGFFIYAYGVSFKKEKKRWCDGVLI